MNQYWLRNINKAEQTAYFICPICLKYKPGKAVHTPLRHFKMPIGQFEVRQMDFIQLPPTNGRKYVLGTVHRFSDCTSAFPFRQATASSVAKAFLEKIIPT